MRGSAKLTRTEDQFAELCKNLEIARTLWRSQRMLVESSEYPKNLADAFKKRYGRTPVNEGLDCGEDILFFVPRQKKNERP